MKIYIAGMVTGAGSFAQITMKFGATQLELQKHGHEVINPLEVVSTWYDQEPRDYRYLQTPWPICMRLCIAALMGADAIYLLPDWIGSRGARIERSLAVMLEMPVCKSMADISQLTTKP